MQNKCVKCNGECRLSVLGSIRYLGYYVSMKPLYLQMAIYYLTLDIFEDIGERLYKHVASFGCHPGGVIYHPGPGECGFTEHVMCYPATPFIIHGLAEQ